MRLSKLVSLPERILQEYRRHRVARFGVWVLLYGAAIWLVERLTGGVPAPLRFIFWGGLFSIGVYYIARAAPYARHWLLWPVRRRLIVTYAFIAVVPILLILVLVGLGVYIINGQLAAFLVVLKLRNRVDALRELDRTVTHEALALSASSPDALLDRLAKFYMEELRQHVEDYPDLRVTIRLGPDARAFEVRTERAIPPVSIPTWLTREEFGGIVLDQGPIELRTLARTATPVGELVAILSQPLIPELLDQVGKGVGPVGILSSGEVRSDQTERLNPVGLRSRSLALPGRAFPFDLAVFGTAPLRPTLWRGEGERRLGAPVFVNATSRIAALNRQILATLGEFSGIYIFVIKAVAVLFLLIEVAALIVGVQLTRSITTTVDKLHNATVHVKSGDFSYRMGLPARDQLSALGESFDSMTTSLERLIRESQEKSRLESEIEIAREVQSQLFPQAPPRVPGVELFAICRPARSVSGDYYDFLRLGHDGVGLALGDVSGKGISAALLMATIQAALHAQLVGGNLAPGPSGGFPVSTAEIVTRLNRQLYESTALEQYATFFFAVYEPTTRRMIYTNAGHLPPVLLRADRVERLKTGGTVVGLFSPATFEQAEIELQPRDVLLAFTDGVTEPENSYGEQFGEERVIEAARRARTAPPDVLAQVIYRSVSDWAGSAELPDDLTLLVAKAIA